MTLIRLSLAEAVGTFTLVLVGCGAATVEQVHPGTVGPVGVALAFGLAVMTMIYAIGDVSGAHLNPAVTMGFVLSGRLNAGRAVPYVLAQTGGAVAAAAMLAVIFQGNETNFGATKFDGAVSAAFALEAVCTCLLMFVILAVATGAKEKGLMAGVAIGAVVAMNALWAGPLTGASMNPARSLGPALVAGVLDHQWLYLVAPVVGAVLGAFAYRFVACGEAEGSASGCC
ncbi:MAG: MIP family channel protein [Phycisphaeraceae bacterium]|nr:MIP family channel protein [Phycisphaeraceae bacterium]